MNDDIVANLRFNAMMFEKMCKPGGRTTIDPEFIRQLCEDWRFAADEIERLRSELRTYTGDGHNTKGEPCTPNTPS